MLIAFEGIDGAGKSTVVARLAGQLTRQGLACTVFASCSLWRRSGLPGEQRKPEPRSRPIPVRRRSARPARAPDESRRLTTAQRFAERWHAIAAPALDAGQLVLADRYVCTALVRDYLRGASEVQIGELYGFAPPADLTVYLDIEPELAWDRKTRHGCVGYYEAGRDVITHTDSMRESFIAFQQLSRERYRQVLAQGKLVRIDASGPPQTVAAAVWAALQPLLAKSTGA